MPTPMNVLADRIRSAYERTVHGHQEWIEGTLELAVALAEARERFPADRDFSVWLAQNDLDRLGANDRASLINMAERPDLLREVLIEQQDKLQPDSLWRKHKERFGKLPKPDVVSENAEISPAEPAPEQKPSAESAPTNNQDQSVTIRHNSPFYGFLRADEVFAMYDNTHGRTTIGKAIRERGGKDLWSLILQALDEKLLTRNSIDFRTLPLRVLFPWGPKAYCARFDLSTAKTRQHVREHIMPAVVAHREELLAAPETLEAVVSRYWKQKEDAKRKASEEKKATDALSAMPADQQEIVVYGVRVWPLTDFRLGSYDYYQICTAVWYFRDLDNLLQTRNDNSPGSRAILIRFSTKWLELYLKRTHEPAERVRLQRVYQVINMLAGLLEKNPDAECMIPSVPMVEGQW
jgi:hypothetical protein